MSKRESCVIEMKVLGRCFLCSSNSDCLFTTVTSSPLDSAVLCVVVWFLAVFGVVFVMVVDGACWMSGS